MKKELLLKKVEEGIRDINLDEKYKQATLQNLKQWLENNDEFIPYHPQIQSWIKNEKWDIIVDSFFRIIPFGTGGRRGLVGIGTNRINTWTIKNSAQGHSRYLIKEYGEEAKKRGVVVFYGVRVFSDNSDYDSSRPNPVIGLSARNLAKSATEVYIANGIKVYFNDEYGTTPELSFSIRHIDAVAGVMIDASHNLPNDCGKKVFDQYGGQLIPPFDQELTDEVTKNVNEIKTIPFEEGKNSNSIEILSKNVRSDYHKAVTALSLSKSRNLKIVYSPLHGPGIFSIKPVLEEAGFEVILDPLTSNLSGKFENVKFNIPNPEVIQSFENSLDFAKDKEADVLLNSDPDADRIGIMVWHKNQWRYLNGNEIGITLTDFISRKKEKGIVIKTDVTTRLIEKIALKNGKDVISNLLVGFKYIGEEINKLDKAGKVDEFIFAAEESHGYIAGNYCRDKDAAIAALWLCELASEMKEKGETLADYLDKIYCQYGYFRNYLTEIRMLGAEGIENIKKMMEKFKKEKPEKIGDWEIEKIKDWKEGDPFLSKTDEESRSVLTFYFKKKQDKEIKVTVRPSGTEPKIKLYIEIGCQKCQMEELTKIKEKAEKTRQEIEKDFLDYCYQAIGVDFPERGYLLFWQLPLKIKLQYFEIEEKIIQLKEIANQEERKKELFKLINFLGSDPIEKVDEAFKKEYGKGIREYLEI